MITKEEAVVIWLDLFEGVTIKRKYEILNSYKNAEYLFLGFKNDFSKFDSFLDANLFSKMSYALDLDFLNKQVIEYERMKVSVITYNSKNYPKTLKQIATPPLVLYCRGDVSLLQNECFSVVGTRRATRYGKRMTEKFATALSNAGFTIVSGLADGIDTESHRATLSAGGKTIAVLGGGVFEIYPQSNIALANEIIEKGLLISEYKPYDKPVNFHFPIRNRIIAGLSCGVLIPEAGLKSGSMHTKEYALEENRDLFVIPGNIDSTESAGCNEIIKHLQGTCVTTPDDILAFYHKTRVNVTDKPQHLQLTIEEKLIIDILKVDEVHYDELVEKTKLDTKTLNSLLTVMQVRGIIKKLPGNLYSI
ncbi:MAG: DNA-protecting protein DprA [Tenericutes bacterium HGW-Tenericutes-4]|nr:MAG: DNA-protecting protein DprA [Tenericutes bacterium HGW-Tenericutes-4]